MRGRERRRRRSVIGCRSLLAVRVAGDHEAEKLARDGPVDTVPGGCPERRFGGLRWGWLTTFSGRKPAYPW